MPTLEWIGKKAVINHHREVPYRMLECVPELSAGDPDSGNLLIEGDNLLALKALLPYYAGKVKCIYIDPPYNTGNEGWIYNDNVNSLEMKNWLGHAVGREAEDLSRHDKWLCMMYPRLSLLKDFLSEDGAIFVSIDDNEEGHLRCLMDEVFGPRNLIAALVWQKRVSPANDAKYFSSDHEYLLVYAKDKEVWRPNRVKRSEDQLKNYKNPDSDPRGPWNSATYTCNKSADERPNLYHPIVNPHTGEAVWPRKTAVWKYDAERHKRNEEQGLVYWGKDGKSTMPRLKVFLSEMGDVVPRSVLLYKDCGHTQEARSEVLSIIAEVPFATTKPARLISRILEIASCSDSLILDSFAGSGTTGHSVLQLNKVVGGNRRFILVEMEPHICQHITAQRLKRVINGYESTKDRIDGLGGGFRYCKLGEPLFDENGHIRPQVKFPHLAAHVFFTETGSPIPAVASGTTPFLGVHEKKAIYLLFNGVLGDKRPNGGNVLTGEVLKNLPPHDGAKVIYGEGCRLSPERLRREGVVFKQVPYEIKVS